MTESLFCTGIPFAGRGPQSDHDRFLKQLGAVMSVSSGVRRFGSAALDLAYVAAGRYEGFWESGLHPWDIAAGIVMVREAGGFVTDLNGENNMMKSGEIIAANDLLHGELKEILSQADK